MFNLFSDYLLKDQTPVLGRYSINHSTIHLCLLSVPLFILPVSFSANLFKTFSMVSKKIYNWCKLYIYTDEITFFFIKDVFKLSLLMLDVYTIIDHLVILLVKDGI